MNEEDVERLNMIRYHFRLDLFLRKAQKARIRQLKPNAYSVAVADYLTVPEITDINTSNYQGAIGDKIAIKAVDDFRVATVRVEIRNVDGSLVESGSAVLTPNGVTWEYTAQVANATFVGDKVIALASDLPGNVTSQEKVL